MTRSNPPSATGVRIGWDEVPRRVTRAIEERLGARVSEAVTQASGFSPALAARLLTTSGARAFVKGVPADRNPDSPQIYRREAAVVSRLPPGLSVPRLLWWFDEGPEGWVVLAFEDVDGRLPAQPWDQGELASIVRAIDGLSAHLTPTPIELPPAADLIGGWRGWQHLAEDPGPGLEPWVRQHLDQLVELEAAAPAAVAGRTLVHLDIRADNLLLAGDRVHIVDWAWASVGAAWLDPLFFAPSVTMQGGPAAAEVFAASRAAARAGTGEVAPALAALTGMFVHHGRLPSPPGLPTLRRFQAAQGEVALRWLRQLLE